MWYQGFIVAIGGFIGGAMRFLAVTLLGKVIVNVFPYGTLAVNILGCLLIGLFMGFSEKHVSFNPDLRLFLATGICGGFTTFSTFAYENYLLLKTEHYLLFAAYAIASYGLGVLSVFIGLLISKS